MISLFPATLKHTQLSRAHGEPWSLHLSSSLGVACASGFFYIFLTLSDFLPTLSCFGAGCPLQTHYLLETRHKLSPPPRPLYTKHSALAVRELSFPSASGRHLLCSAHRPWWLFAHTLPHTPHRRQVLCDIRCTYACNRTPYLSLSWEGIRSFSQRMLFRLHMSFTSLSLRKTHIDSLLFFFIMIFWFIYLFFLLSILMFLSAPSCMANQTSPTPFIR